MDKLPTPDITNSVEFDNEYIRCAETGIWKKLPRENINDIATRRFRRVYRDNERHAHHIVHQAIESYHYDLTSYYNHPKYFQRELDEFFFQHNYQAQKDIKCYHDMKVLGYNSPKVEFNLCSKSINHKPYRDPQNKAWFLEIEQSYRSITSTQTIDAPNIKEILLDKNMSPAKKNMILEDQFYRAIVLAIGFGNIDCLKYENTIVADIDQPRPKEFYTFDHEYAYMLNLDAVIAQASIFHPKQLANADWTRVQKNLIEFQNNAKENSREMTAGVAEYCISNVTQALGYIQEEKYKNIHYTTFFVK